MSTVIKAKINKMLDKAEDPSETLEYSYAKQMELRVTLSRIVDRKEARGDLVRFQRDHPADCNSTKSDGLEFGD